jgi:hypothetical protein
MIEAKKKELAALKVLGEFFEKVQTGEGKFYWKLKDKI